MRGVQAWQALAPRDRALLKGLGVFLLAVVFFQALWQPARHRMASAEAHYQQQRLVAEQVQSARQQGAPVPRRPSVATLNTRAEAAGLEVEQVEVEGERLRLTLHGQASALLQWLAQLEREAGAFNGLTLEKRGTRLEARIEL